MTSEKHKVQQEEWKAQNLQTYFTNGERIEVKESLAAFKKRMPLHPDNFKASYATFKL